ncbi:protein disulfide reductase [Variovorax sp. KBW07]|nr:protein disulfide reductase [Variovorax sp. KBW07]
MMAGLLAAGAASAQANIVVGGGATLPEILYDDILPSGVGKTDFSYSGTGSGIGKSAFLSNVVPRSGTATSLKTNYYNESQGSDNLSFLWPVTQSVHFAGSDSALSATERDTYNTAHVGKPATDPAAWGRLIQIPAVATSVLLPYKRTGVTALDLTDAKVCAVFSNKPLIVSSPPSLQPNLTWEQLLGTATPTNPGTNLVRVVYRTDTSGTTELLSRYLAAACSGSGFAVSNAFTTVVSGAVTGGTIPSHWVGVTGSSGVSSAFGTDGRIGYLSPETNYTGSDNSVVAKINGNLPAASAIRTVLAGTALPTAGLTAPELTAAMNPLNWVPAYAKPATGYPIFGTTNLLVNQCYKDTVVQGKIKTFLAGLYGTTYDTKIETTHNFVNLPATGTTTTNWKKAINDVFLSGTHPLAIGNTNVCNGIGRPVAAN